MAPRIQLASSGWIDDRPPGNRLRWRYPYELLDGGGAALGLPKELVVERAPLKDFRPLPIDAQGVAGRRAFSTSPAAWWTTLGDIAIGGFPATYVPPTPLQGIVFTYRGPDARLLVTDAGVVVRDELVSDGTIVAAEGAELDSVIVLGFSATLQDVRALDLYANHGLAWKAIAVIGVEGTLNASLADVESRLPAATALTPARWAELQSLAQEAQSGAGLPPGPGQVSPWQAYSAVIALRWEIAVLCGHGYVDGPQADACALDSISPGVALATPQFVAYRVRDRSGRAAPSNAAVCPGWPVAPLSLPPVPQYLDLRVGLSDATGSGVFAATGRTRWSSSDPEAIGVELEERLGPSPAIGGGQQSDLFETRGRPVDGSGGGELGRSWEPPFWDVPVAARARAIDAWDRTSGFTAFSPPAGFELVHNPVAPSLLDARWDGGIATLRRPSTDTWAPDAIVRNAPDGRLEILRRTGLPRRDTVAIGTPVLLVDGTYASEIDPVVNPGDFTGGSFSSGAFRGRIQSIVGTSLSFAPTSTAMGSTSLFQAGVALLVQDPKADPLWAVIGTVPLGGGLPMELAVPDPMPPPADGTDVLTYAVRVAFLGRFGPKGNSVGALRVDIPPPAPPPFDVALLGLDFYGRTMVEITLTSPVPTERRFVVAWAPGTVNGDQFASSARPGPSPAQPASWGTTLYEVLTLPVRSGISEVVTVGVQSVGPGGGQSDFLTVAHTLPARP
jgi:hypothetical protein